MTGYMKKVCVSSEINITDFMNKVIRVAGEKYYSHSLNAIVDCKTCGIFTSSQYQPNPKKLDRDLKKRQADKGMPYFEGEKGVWTNVHFFRQPHLTFIDSDLTKIQDIITEVGHELAYVDKLDAYSECYENTQCRVTMLKLLEIRDGASKYPTLLDSYFIPPKSDLDESKFEEVLERQNFSV